MLLLYFSIIAHLKKQILILLFLLLIKLIKFDMFCLYLSFNIKNFKIDSYFNKYKCSFNKDENLEIIEFLKKIEKNIMNNSTFEQSQPLYRISEQLEQGYIKIFSNNNINIPDKDDGIDFILKISGIWTEKETYGLTFRFFLSVSNK